MNNTKLLLTLSLSMCAVMATAQNEDDAYMMSQGTPASTALSLGMGGVGASMGGDFNTLSINPSGIAIYRSGEAMITPLYKFGNNRSTLENNATTESVGKLSLANAGIVFHRNVTQGKWKSIAFGFGMNTIANYNEHMYAEGNSSKISITDVFAASAQEFGTNETSVPPYGFLGYQAYLLDNSLNSVVPLNTLLQHTKAVSHSGSKKEYALTLGGNYDERIMLGATLGLQSIGYNRTTTNSEKDLSGLVNNNFDNLELIERLTTQGFGANVKLGGTFIINPSLRLGLAFHTPTWISLTDQMDYRLESNTENYKADAGFQDKNPISLAQPNQGYQFSYNLTTPWRLVMGATAIVSNKAMISADYEYVPYQSMRYRMNDAQAYERIVNDNIVKQYVAAHKVRIGGELALDNLFLRAGAAYHTSPYKDASVRAGDRLDLSIGGGLRFENFFIDLGYMNTQMKSTDLLHDVSAVNSLNPVIGINGSHHNIALTLGLKFRNRQ